MASASTAIGPTPFFPCANAPDPDSLAKSAQHKQRAQALLDLDLALDIDPYHIEALSIRSEIYSDLAKADKKASLKTDSGYSWDLEERSELYRDLAGDDIKRILAIDPYNSWALAQIGEPE